MRDKLNKLEEIQRTTHEIVRILHASLCRIASGKPIGEAHVDATNALRGANILMQMEKDQP